MEETKNKINGVHSWQHNFMYCVHCSVVHKVVLTVIIIIQLNLLLLFIIDINDDELMNDDYYYWWCAYLLLLTKPIKRSILRIYKLWNYGIHLHTYRAWVSTINGEREHQCKKKDWSFDDDDDTHKTCTNSEVVLKYQPIEQSNRVDNK